MIGQSEGGGVTRKTPNRGKSSILQKGGEASLDQNRNPTPYLIKLDYLWGRKAQELEDT